MAGRVTYKKSIKGLNEIMRGKPMEAEMRHQAQVGKQYAEAIAAGFIRTGDYASSFRVSSTSSGGPRHDRAAGYLFNDSDHALLVEVVDDHRVLGTVVDIIEQGGV